MEKKSKKSGKIQSKKANIKQSISKAHTKKHENIPLNKRKVKKIKYFSDLGVNIPQKLPPLHELCFSNEYTIIPTLPTFNLNQEGWCYGASTKQGSYRESNQDRFCVVSPIQSDPHGILAGVFDGFETEFCSKLLSETLLFDLNSALPSIDKMENKLQFLLKNLYEQLILKMESENQKGGSTSIVSVIAHKQIIIANIGDSFSCLIKKDKSILLNKLHNASNPSEATLIENRGGYILSLGNIPRVQGEIMLTRAVGVFRLNEILSREPEIFTYNIEDDDLYLVMGTDGLIGFISLEEIFNYFNTHQKESNISLAEGLVNLALNKNSSDNVTAIVLNLRTLVQGPFPEDKCTI